MRHIKQVLELEKEVRHIKQVLELEKEVRHIKQVLELEKEVRHIKQVLELENGVQQEKSMVLCGTTSLSNGFSLVVTLLKDIVYLYINLSFFFFTDHYLQHVESKKCSDQLKMNIKSL